MTSKAFGLAQLGNVFDDGALSSRNLIINGAMQVAQRGTSATGNVNYTADRFINFQNIGTLTTEQSTDAPDGFQYSLKRTNGTGTTATSGDYSLVRYQVEGFDAVQLSQATSSAKTVTISFWVKSSVTGTYFVALSDAADLIQYPAAYTVNSANIWEKKEVTITGYTGSSGTWNKGNTVGLKVHWDLGSGPSRQASTADAWNTSVGSWSHSSQVDWVGTTGATFYITGVQLEVGDTATPFEHRSYGDELARCQRYYQQEQEGGFARIGVVPTAVTNREAPYKLRVEMRAAPTVTVSGGSYYTFSTASQDAFTSTTAAGINKYGFYQISSGSVSRTAGDTLALDNWLIKADAEL